MWSGCLLVRGNASVGNRGEKTLRGIELSGADCRTCGACAAMAGATMKGTPVSAEMRVPLLAVSGTVGTHLKIKSKATKGRAGPIGEARRTGT
jgi:hypothetical protein